MDAEKKETKEINKMSLLIMAVVVLLLVIAGAVYYIFNQKSADGRVGTSLCSG